MEVPTLAVSPEDHTHRVIVPQCSVLVVPAGLGDGAEGVDAAVGANRPRLLAALKALPWREVPAGARSTERGHGRRATRTIKVTDTPHLPDWPQFAGAALIALIEIPQ